ncbi:MAG: response regulator, partial [Planctomycetales bacterium]|nr:response regulator [Planctomycetales bacterium]
NAIKFSEKKDVQLRARLAEHHRDDGRLGVRFDIIDRGIGISPANQAKLFQAFSQAESTTTRRFGGTGLGLAICKRLTELMNGHLGVESAEGKGSTFWVELPFTVADHARTHEKKRELSGLTAWIVAAPPDRRDVIDTYLSHWGADVAHFDTTTGVVERLGEALRAKAPPDAIILDFEFDTSRQSEAVEAIRAAQKRRSHKIPQIVLEDYQHRGARIRNGDTITVDANPLIRYRLITAVAVAAGRASPEAAPVNVESVIEKKSAPTVEEAFRRGELVLLTEDNLTNQDVIRRQLGLLGYACEVANNGAEGLKAYKSGRYAMILTDCHMPEMDGYEMTGAIRKAEAGSKARIPIVAVTANALHGEA